MLRGNTLKRFNERHIAEDEKQVREDAVLRTPLADPNQSK
jgi:hypothetical protein